MNVRKGNILILIPSIIAILAIVAAGYLFWQNQQKKTEAPSLQTQENSQPENVEKKTVLTELYLGRISQSGLSSALNLSDGTIKEFVPTGYKIIDGHNYNPFPTYLILEKNKKLYSYQLDNKLLIDIFGNNILSMQENEGARIYPSISEKNRFFITINRYGPAGGMGMGIEPILESRYYFFNALTNQFLESANKSFYNNQTCFEYDSKNSRFFTWPCGEGIGSTLPISIVDLNGINKKEVIPAPLNGIRPKVNYNNGQFIIISPRGQVNGKYTAFSNSPLPNEVTLFDPSNLQKNTYTFSDNAASQIQEFSPYSAIVSKTTNTIVVGGANDILLLKFDSSNKITEAKYIPEREIYANFIFVYNENLYYQTRSAIKVVNLVTNQVEKSWPLTHEEEITLLSF